MTKRKLAKKLKTVRKAAQIHYTRLEARVINLENSRNTLVGRINHLEWYKPKETT